MIREFDARGWNTGFRSCAAWLSWRVGLDPGAGRERVRVARALGGLPLLARTRTIPPALRRVLAHRDQGCRFPGCGGRFAEGHHLRH